MTRSLTLLTAVFGLALCACGASAGEAQPGPGFDARAFDGASLGDDVQPLPELGASDAPVASDERPPPLDASLPPPSPRDEGLTPSACDDLPPGTDPVQTVTAIQRCLDTVGHAYLRAGTTYDLAPTPITIGAGAVLRGRDPRAYSVLRAAAPAQSYDGTYPKLVYLLNSAAGAVGGRLENVKVDMRDARSAVAGRAVHALWIEGDNNTVAHVEVTSTPVNHRTQLARGVYFHTGTGNVADGVNVHDTALAVYFGGRNTAAMAPTFIRGTIAHNRGDSVTLAGYGRVIDSTIFQNGWDDGDSPSSGAHLPPGGAIYASAANRVGGVIDGNRIHDQCGANIELGQTTGFTVTRNTVYQPGWTGMNGTGCPSCQTYVPPNFCHATMSVLLFDVDHLVVTDNVIENSNRPANNSGYSGNPDAWFGVGKTDLPVPNGTTIGLVLAEGARHCDATCTTHFYTVANRFERNHVAATGVPTGVAWFVGRDTGFGPGGAWSTATANVFDDNTHCNLPDTACTAAPFTVRYGKNRYGTGSTCRAADGRNLYDGPAGANRCNRDDFVHVGGAADVLRNDDTARYHY